MIDACEIRLARLEEAERIAVMSRDFIEHGLGWGWDAPRVARRIRHRNTNVVVAQSGTDVVGFGVMEYHEVDAHLLLFGVEPIHRNRGIGSSLLNWLETTATTAGIELIFERAATASWQRFRATTRAAKTRCGSARTSQSRQRHEAIACNRCGNRRTRIGAWLRRHECND